MQHQHSLMGERQPNGSQLILKNYNNNWLNRSEEKMGKLNKKQIPLKVYSNKFLRESMLGKCYHDLQNNIENCYIKSRNPARRYKTRLSNINKTANKNFKIRSTEFNDIQDQLFITANKLNEDNSKVCVKTQNMIHRHKSYKSEIDLINTNQEVVVFKPNSDIFADKNECQNNHSLVKQNSFYCDTKMKKRALSFSRALEFFSSLITHDHQLLQKLKLCNNKQLIRQKVLKNSKLQQVSLSNLTKKISMEEKALKRLSVCSSSNKVRRHKQASSNDLIIAKSDNYQLNGWEVTN